MRPAALQALAEIAEALGRLAREAAADDDYRRGDHALVPIAEAARQAATSVRVVREAIRKGELVAFGRRRDRSVRWGDLNAWIASREVGPVKGLADDDIERRMARLAGEDDDGGGAMPPAPKGARVPSHDARQNARPGRRA